MGQRVYRFGAEKSGRNGWNLCVSNYESKKHAYLISTNM